MSISPVEPTAVLAPGQEPAADAITRFPEGALPPERNPYWVYLLQRPEGESRRTMQGCLDRLAELLSPTRDPSESAKGSGATLAWWNLSWQHAAAIKTVMIDRGYSASHINKNLSAYRAMMKTCRRLGLMSMELSLAAADIDNEKMRKKRRSRRLGEEEIAAILAACLRDGTPLGIRDAAIIAVLRSTGARRAEVAGLDIDSFCDARSLRITGKGRKERDVYLTETALEYVNRWLAFLGAKSGPLFRPFDRWGKTVYPRHMDKIGIGRTVEQRVREAGLRPATTHDFRHTFVGDLLDKGVDIVIVQTILGHESPVTTSDYDPRPGAGRLSAVDKLHLPRPEELLAKAPGDGEGP